MGADFEDAWDALNDDERSLLLEWRHTRPIPAHITTVLIRLGLSIEPQPGLFPAPTHWPAGFVDFLDCKAAVIGDDPECE